MDDWQIFRDPEFALRFKYPTRSTDGEPVDRVETQQEGMLRVHILAPKSREVYFEVTRYDSLPAASEYRLHKEYLANQFQSLAITEVAETVCGSLPAYKYTFQWDQGERVVILVERGEATYRLIYNPRFLINLQILSSVEWLDLP